MKTPKLKKWRVEMYGRARKVGHVIAATRKEALEKVDDGEWDCHDTHEWFSS
jgi:hypothetical protein